MKRSFGFAILGTLLFSLLLPGSVVAGTVPTWNSAIMWFNPTNASGTLTVQIYDNSTPLTPGEPISLIGYQSGSILVGSTGTVQGSAMVSASVPLVAVYKQYPASGSYAPLLYTSYDASQAGPTFYIPTVTISPIYVSTIGIQNVDSVAVDLTLKFYDKVGSVKATKSYLNVATNASQAVNLTDLTADLGVSFDGSLVITAVQTGTNIPGSIVAAAQELERSGGRRAYASEGAAAGANKVFLPSAMCKYGRTQQTSYFAVQNAGTAATTVRVTYYDAAGKKVTAYDHGTLAAGAKVSINSCDTRVASLFSGKNGTAVIESKGATGTTQQPLVVVGKVTSTDGLATAYLAPGKGASEIAIPYIEVDNARSGLRTYLAIMNASSSAVSGAHIIYYNENGDMLNTINIPTIPAYSKVNLLPAIPTSAFSGGVFQGAAIVTGTNLVVMIRLQQAITGLGSITTLGEDYLGIPTLP